MAASFPKVPLPTLKKLNFTSLEVRGSPLWNFTSFLRLNFQVSSSICSQLSARQGDGSIFSLNSKSVSKMLPSIIRFTVTLFPRGSRVAGSLSKATTRVSLDETFSVSDVCTGPFSTPADADSDEVSEGAGEDPSVVCFSSPPLPQAVKTIHKASDKLKNRFFINFPPFT